MKRLVTILLPFTAAACVMVPVRSAPPAYLPPPPPQYVPPPAPVPSSPAAPQPPTSSAPSAPSSDVPVADPVALPTSDNYSPPPPVVSVYVDPPIAQPEPIGVPWAPPPMLVEDPGPMPFYGAYWTGGYWVWDGQWVWAHGRWLAPPVVGYGWAPPYYENRDGLVVFVPGFWQPPGYAFVAPPPTLSVVVVAARPGIDYGPPCVGPNGVFVPAPPGSSLGVIVPAPVGTAPAVVVGAPPVTRAGMTVTPGGNGQMQVQAPPGVTVSGAPVRVLAPQQAHLAAAQTPVVRALAPLPASSRPIPTYNRSAGFSALPAARSVQPVVVQAAALRPAAANAGAYTGVAHGTTAGSREQRFAPANSAAARAANSPRYPARAPLLPGAGGAAPGPQTPPAAARPAARKAPDRGERERHN